MTIRTPNVLEVEDLWVEVAMATGTVPLVRGATLAVKGGEIVGIVGESGSGKSLTALTLMRLNPAPTRISAGSIVLGGRSLLELSEREMQRVRGGAVAMIYQDPLSSLNPVRSIGWQLSQTIRIHDSSVTRRQALERAVELLAAVGIDDPRRRCGEHPHQLSGGMRQRVMIAMAIAPNPQLLIADEATTALDVTTQARILELLASVAEERHMAMLVITHDMSVASTVCDGIYVMYAGRFVESAPTMDALERPLHPYTKALMESICTLETDPERPLPAMGGQPPVPGTLAGGCAFAPRCRLASEECTAVDPPAVILGRRKVECLRVSEGAPRRAIGAVGACPGEP